MSKNSNEQKTNEKYRNKKVRGAERDLPKCAENTIRSKIEDKLTEEKLKDRESAANPNTPWAPSGPERIEFAYDKVPLRAHREGRVRKVRVPGNIFSRFFAESVPKSSFKDLGTKNEPKRAKGTVHNSKWSQNMTNTTKWNQKGIKRVPTDAKVAPKSCLGAFEVFGFLH